MKAIERIEMIEHCIRQIQRYPYKKEGLEHFIFLHLLEMCPEFEYKKIIEQYKYLEQYKYIEQDKYINKIL